MFAFPGSFLSGLVVDATELVQALVRLGASGEIYNVKGQTARKTALEAGHVQVVEFLEGCQPPRHEPSRVLFTSEVDLRTKPSTESDPRMADWTCTECGTSVFASRRACFRCSAPKPKNRPEDEYVTGVSPYYTRMLRELRRPEEGNTSD
jgi:hypothetical protein